MWKGRIRKGTLCAPAIRLRPTAAVFNDGTCAPLCRPQQRSSRQQGRRDCKDRTPSQPVCATLFVHCVRKFDVLLEAAHIGRRFCDTTAAVLFAPMKTAARSLDRRKHVSSVLCCSSDSPEHSLVYVYRTQMYALANFTTVFSFFYFSGFPLSQGLFSWHRNRHLPPLYRKRIRATYSLFSVTVTRRLCLVVHALFL